ncbi:hypothetical protein FA95DRAFT_1622643 [Auriscalpium vulgare]|uniref:Uncharacterized protein n=1 Tax=Auriscalpium vulgare TaxID=40419 RepID=A0ACB8RL78_9AGAM|nr:hypothetical protein FA95DRAFT_1622643 [Auriscalpium vulgare]
MLATVLLHAGGTPSRREFEPEGGADLRSIPHLRQFYAESPRRAKVAAIWGRRYFYAGYIPNPRYFRARSAVAQLSALHSLRGMRIIERVEEQPGGAVGNVASGPAMTPAGGSSNASVQGIQEGDQAGQRREKTRQSGDAGQRMTRSHSRREAEKNGQPATPSAALGDPDAPGKGGERSLEGSKGRGRGPARGGERGRARGRPRGTARGTARGRGGVGRGGGRCVEDSTSVNNVADEGEAQATDKAASASIPSKRKVNDQHSPNPEKAKKTKKTSGVPAPAQRPFHMPTTAAWGAHEGGADVPVPAFEPVLPALPPYPPITPPSETFGYAPPQLRMSPEPGQFSFSEYKAPEEHVPVVDPMLDQLQAPGNEKSDSRTLTAPTPAPTTRLVPSQRPRGPVHPAIASANRTAAQMRGSTPSTAGRGSAQPSRGSTPSTAGRGSVPPVNGTIGAPVRYAVPSANRMTAQSRGTTPSTALAGRGFAPPTNRVVGPAASSGQRSRAQSQAPDAGGSEWGVPNRPKPLSSGPPSRPSAAPGEASMRPPAEPAMKSDGVPKVFSIKLNQAERDISVLKNDARELTKQLTVAEQRVAALEQENIALRKSHGNLKDELGELKELVTTTSDALMALDRTIKGAEGLSGADKKAAAQATKSARNNNWNTATRKAFCCIMGIPNMKHLQPAMEDGFFAVDEENPEEGTMFLRPDFGQSWSANAAWHEWAVNQLIKGNVVFHPYLRTDVLDEKGREGILTRLKDLFKSAKNEWKRQGMDAGLIKTKLSADRRKARKTGKSVDRSIHREEANLEHAEWDFLFMPGYQSTDASSDGYENPIDPNTDDENDGPGLVKPWITHAPTHRSALVQGKIDELSDLAGIRIMREVKEGRKSTHRRKRGEPIDRPIPVIAKGAVKIPGWAIDRDWLGEFQDDVNWSLLDMEAPLPHGYADEAEGETPEDSSGDGMRPEFEDGSNDATTSVPEDGVVDHDQAEDGYRDNWGGQYDAGHAGEETWGAPPSGLTADEEEDLYMPDE